MSRPKEFGLILGGLLAFFGWRLWRKGFWIFPWLLGLAAVLALTALLAPRRLVSLETVWLRGARVLARINTTILLGLIYYLIITPAGLVMRLFSDPLERRREGESYWKEVKTGEDMSSYHRLF